MRAAPIALVALIVAACAGAIPAPTPLIIYVTPAPTPVIIYVTPAPTPVIIYITPPPASGEHQRTAKPRRSPAGPNGDDPSATPLMATATPVETAIPLKPTLSVSCAPTKEGPYVVNEPIPFECRTLLIGGRTLAVPAERTGLMYRTPEGQGLLTHHGELVRGEPYVDSFSVTPTSTGPWKFSAAALYTRAEIQGEVDESDNVSEFELLVIGGRL